MTDQPNIETWEQIEELVERQDSPGLTAYLAQLSPSELARAMSRLSEDDQSAVLTLLDPEDAADVIEELHEAVGADLIEDLPVPQAAAIMDEMDSDIRADVLSELDHGDLEAILLQMSPEEAQDARALLVYPSDTAGGLMITEYLAYNESLRVHDVLNDLRENAETYSDYGVQYVYVVSDKGNLVGVVRLRDLVLSPGSTPLAKIQILNPISVSVDATLVELEQVFDRHMFFGVPVVDNFGKLVGVVERADVEEAHGEVAERTFLRFGGIVGGEELRSMPMVSRAFRRLSFLTPNVFLNIMAASVIALYESTLAQVIALAVFLPVISDMSGCAGSQAVAVSIRELSLGLVKPRDFLRVWWQEASVALFNGIVLGAMILGIGMIWKGHFYLAAIAAFTLFANTMIGTSVGAVLPLAIRGMGIDPALAAAPILTTITDMCGFFICLSLAALALSWGVL
ncbi:MAG: magnesium transporter [Candidatus Hydrogenedentes bacterium]|nr:magnesium transporter [Candidatus Hydrogenedentota bacterium]